MSGSTRTSCGQIGRSLAIQIAGATRFELENHRIEERIEAGHGLVGGMALCVGADNAQNVIGKIARAIHGNVAVSSNPESGALDCCATFLTCTWRMRSRLPRNKISCDQALRRAAKKRDVKRFLVGADLDVVETVAVAGVAHGFPPRLVFA